VSYTITVPASATAAGAGSASDILNILANTNASALTTSVSSGIASTSSGNFLVVVQSIRQVQSSTPGTSTSPSPYTTVEPVNRGGIDLEEEDDGTPVAAIVVSLSISVCCCCGMLGGAMWYYAKQRGMTVRQLLNSGGDQIEPAVSPVVPQPQPVEAWSQRVVQPVGQQQELPRVLSPELQAVRDMEDSQNQAIPGVLT